MELRPEEKEESIAHNVSDFTLRLLLNCLLHSYEFPHRLTYIESDNPEERQDVNVGNLAFAGEHLSDEFYGFMNGAAQTGRLAAELVVRRIRRST